MIPRMFNCFSTKRSNKIHTHVVLWFGMVHDDVVSFRHAQFSRKTQAPPHKKLVNLEGLGDGDLVSLFNDTGRRGLLA